MPYPETVNPWRITEGVPSTEDFNRLRELAGWNRIDPQLVQTGLANSVLALLAILGDEVIGFVRLVGDGAMKLSVEELLVHPAYRRQGIATALMERIMTHIDSLPAGCTVNLMAAEGLADFYAAFGFKLRPENRPGMQLRR